MNKNIIRYSALGLCFIQSLNYTAIYAENDNILPIENPNKSDIISSQYNEDNTKKFDEFINKIIKAQEEKDLELLDEVLNEILEFTPTLTSEEGLKYISGEFSRIDEIDYIMRKIIYLGTSLNKDEDKNKFLIELADNIYISVVNRQNNKLDINVYQKTIEYLNNIVINHFSQNIEEEGYEYTQKMVVDSILNLDSMTMNFGTPTILPEGSEFLTEEEQEELLNSQIPLEPLPSTLKPEFSISDAGEAWGGNQVVMPPPLEENTSKPNNGNNNNNKPTEPEKPVEPTLAKDKEYKTKGKDCYLVTTYYDDKGNKVKSEEEQVSKRFCGIYDYEVVDGESYVENQNTISNSLTVSGSNSNDSTSSSNAEDENTTLQNNKVIIFTTNKSDENPYYFKTSIKVSDNLITYSQLKDVLNELSNKINGYVIEDKEKLMFIGEGKPVIIKENKKGYSIENIKSLLNNFKNLGISVGEIEDFKNTKKLLEEGKLNSIEFNNEVIELKNKPKLQNNTLMFNIEEIFKLIDVNVEKKENKIILSKDDKILEFILGSDTLIINNEEIKLDTKSTNEGYADISLALSKFGFNLILDNEKLIISK